MRRGYYSTFCRIWQDKRAAPKGGNPSVTGCARATFPPGWGRQKKIPRVGDGLPRRCAPRNDGELGIDKRWKAGIMKVGGSPCLLTEVIVSWGTMGGYFFFIWIYLENQRNDADDQNAELNEIRIRDHLHHSLM